MGNTAGHAYRDSTQTENPKICESTLSILYVENQRLHRQLWVNQKSVENFQKSKSFSKHKRKKELETENKKFDSHIESLEKKIMTLKKHKNLLEANLQQSQSNREKFGPKKMAYGASESIEDRGMLRPKGILRHHRDRPKIKKRVSFWDEPDNKASSSVDVPELTYSKLTENPDMSENQLQSAICDLRKENEYLHRQIELKLEAFKSYAVMNRLSNNRKKRKLQIKNEMLSAQIEDLKNEITTLEEQIKELHKYDTYSKTTSESETDSEYKDNGITQRSHVLLNYLHRTKSNLAHYSQLQEKNGKIIQPKNQLRF